MRKIFYGLAIVFGILLTSFSIQEIYAENPLWFENVETWYQQNKISETEYQNIVKFLKTHKIIETKSSELGIITPVANCDISNQSPNEEIDEKNVELPSMYPYGDSEQKFIAKVLNTNPIVLEKYVDSKDRFYMLKGLEIKDRYFRGIENPPTFSHLKFGQLIEATSYGYLYDAGELAFGSALKDIKLIKKTPKYLIEQVGEDPFAEQKGTLIRYVPTTMTGANEVLIIFKDGSMYYRDNHNNIITDSSLSQIQLDKLLQTFADSDFDKLEMTHIHSSSPAVTLICDRYQKVQIKNNESKLQEVTDELDKIKGELNDEFQYYITYKEKEKLTITPWSFEEITPEQAVSLKDDARTTYGSHRNIPKTHEIFTAIPQDILEKFPDTPISPNLPRSHAYFTYDDKLYMVSKGLCLPNHNVCLDDTFYLLSAGEIAEPVGKFGHGIKLWPDELDMDLTSISDDGEFLSREKYNEHEDFYSKFFERFPGDRFFIHGDYLFKNVNIEKRLE